MITKGMIITIGGVLGLITTIICFIIMNRSIKNKLNMLMEGSISNEQYESKVNERINKYVVNNRVVNDESTTWSEEQATTLDNESTILDDESTILDDESTTWLDDEETTLLEV